MEAWYRVLIQFNTITERFAVGYEFEEGLAHRMDADHPADLMVSLGYLEPIATPPPPEIVPEDDGASAAAAAAPDDPPPLASVEEGGTP